MSINVADGRNTYLKRTSQLAGVTDSKKGTLSAWLRMTAGDGANQTIFIIRNSGSLLQGINFARAASNKVVINGRDSSDSANLALQSDASWVIANGWFHVVASWDLGASGGAVGKMYINRASAGTLVTGVNSNIDYTRDLCELFVIDPTNDSAGGPIQWAQGMELYDLAFWPGLFVDLTDATVLARFISSDGITDQANPGPTAGTPKPVGYNFSNIGAIPALFFSGPFTHNMGNGGPFVLTGRYTAESTTEPAVYRQSGSPDARPGERSFDSEKSGFTYPRHKTFIERREGNPDYGLRMGLDERSGRTRDDNPGYRLSHFIFQDREEDDEEYDR